MESRLSRLITLALTALRQAIPIGGVLQLGWHPVSALAIYWIEALLLALVAAGSVALIERRSGFGAIQRAKRTGPRGLARALQDERDALRRAKLDAKGVFGFHVGSVLAFGGFFAGVVAVLVGNGYVDAPPNPWEVMDGVQAMVLTVGIGLLFDLAFFGMPVGAAEARVSACMSRWALFWTLGFFGGLTMVFTDRPGVFFPLFAGLKAAWELLGMANRLFGPGTVAAPAESA